MSKIELRQAVSAEAQLRPNFRKPLALVVRSTPRMWVREDAHNFMRLVDNAHELYLLNPALEVFEYARPIDPSVVDLFTGSLVALTVGKQVWTGRLLPQTSHTVGDGGVLRYKLFMHGMLFRQLKPQTLTSPVMKRVARSSPKVDSVGEDAKSKALNDLAPYMLGAPFDPRVWLDEHWVTVRNALAA